jgi:hypothetical protein
MTIPPRSDSSRPFLLLVVLCQLSGTECAGDVFAPPVPYGLMCRAGAKSSELSCSFTPSAGASLYDVELAHNASAPPFMSVTSALYEVVVPGLLPAMGYYARVRAHASEQHGGGRQQMIIGWSNFSAAVRCETKPAPAAALALRLRRDGGLDPAGVGSIAVAWESGPAAEFSVVSGGRCSLQHGMSAAGFLGTRETVDATQGRAVLTGLVPGAAYDVSLSCGASITEPGTRTFAGYICVRTVVHPRPDLCALAVCAVTLRTGTAETLWIEPLRVSENLMVWPDYLANHNSGTMEGDVAFLTGAGAGHFFLFDTSPRVKYCVEIAKQDLSKIPRTPSGPPEIPVNYSFAEYLSCNGNGSGPDMAQIQEWGNYT